MRVITKPPAKITRATIEATWRQRSADQRLIVRDKECRGLALVVNATAMTWVFGYRPRGIDAHTGKRWPNRTVTIGNPGSHSPDDARAEANRIKGQAAAGHDPAAERKARAEIERRKRSATLGRLLDDYAESLPRRPKMRGVGLPSAAYVVKSLPKMTPFSRSNPTPLEVSDRLFEAEDRRAVGLRGVIGEVLGSRSFSPCRTPVVAR